MTRSIVLLFSLGILTPAAHAAQPTYSAVQTDGGLFGVFQKVGANWKQAAWMNAYDIDPDGTGPMPVERREHWYLFKAAAGQTAWDANNLNRRFRYYGAPMAKDKRPYNDQTKITEIEYVVKYRSGVTPVAVSNATTSTACASGNGRTLCPTYYEIRHDSAGSVVGHVNVFDVSTADKRENFSLLNTPGGWLRANATNCLVDWILTPHATELIVPVMPPPVKDEVVPDVPGITTWDRNWASTMTPQTTTYLAPPGTPPSCPP